MKKGGGGVLYSCSVPGDSSHPKDLTDGAVKNHGEPKQNKNPRQLSRLHPVKQ